LKTLLISHNDLEHWPECIAHMRNLTLLGVAANNFEPDQNMVQFMENRGCTVQSSLPDGTPAEILPRLYLGSFVAARDVHFLRRHGIKHVLNVAVECHHQLYPQDFTYHMVPLIDNPSCNLLPRIKECVEFIETGRNAGGVLVHCAAGKSRSASIVIIYCMIIDNMTFVQAFDFVKGKRSRVSPNGGFVEQMKAFEREKTKISAPRCIVS